MSVQNSGILVTFNTISKPGWPTTYPVKAVAMDQSDSTALATYINRHYVVKGIGLFGGAFLQGYGQAMQQQGQTTVVDPSGGVVTQSQQLDAGQVARTAQGSVAQKFGQKLEQSSNSVQNTIRVQGKNGESFPIRILFLENF
jgi:intracellular multiplication protein IcmE